MSRFLFAWELGVGLGHVGTFLPIANSLHERGHLVVAAVKQLSSIWMYAGKPPSFPVLSAPPEGSPTRKAFPVTSTYAQLLHNTGFGDPTYLNLKVQAWLDLYQVTDPDLVLCDHSPMAQLAAFISGRKYALLGTGFTCPALNPRLPVMERRSLPELAVQLQQEATLLEHCNLIAEIHGGKKLCHLADLYAHASETILLTHEELDHFPKRQNPMYFGSWNFIQGQAPKFPSGQGPKVFGYLKPSPKVEELLAELSRLHWPALIVGTGFDDEFVKKYSSATLIVSNRPVDNEAAAAWCDFAILNSTHASVAVMLRAGKPILCLPLQLEQLLMSRRIVDLKMGGTVVARDAKSYKLGLKLMGERFPALSIQAQKFAARYRDYNPTTVLKSVTDLIEKLALPISE